MPDEMVKEATTIGNFKAIAEQPAMLSNLAYSNAVTTNNLGQQNAVSNQMAVNELGISVVAKGSNTISNLGPLQARSAVDVLTNNELAQTIADLKASLEAFLSGGASGGDSGKGSLARLKKLIEIGLRLTEEGIIVPPGIPIIVYKERNVTREDVQVKIEGNKVVLKVTES